MKKFLVLFGFMFLVMSKMTFAQNANDKISLDLKDAPVRSTLELAFKQAGINNYFCSTFCARIALFSPNMNK